MSPIAVEPDFTRKYLQSSNNEALVKKIIKAFDRVAWEKDFVLCEGSGHAGVGSVFDLSNAQVAKILGAKVIIISQGGIGKPIDEVYLNQAVFEREGVEVIGVILNKVTRTNWITSPNSRGAVSNAKAWIFWACCPSPHSLQPDHCGSIQEDLEADRSINASGRAKTLSTAWSSGRWGRKMR